ncbi:MAG TPA: cyclic nucleotide-binding domain-containing protein, partial [Micromonosporaceae bacterium]|nr:cyclic nucleotide-binding domain-containing protein [Micromonosporaceae bacterium]
MITTTYDLLAGHPFLVGMAPEQLTRLAVWGHRSVFRLGGPIFEEGGHADRFWLIRDGRVRLQTQVPGRGETVVETLGPGTVLGWSWLFAPYRWHFGATAMEPTLTIVFDADGVRRLCAQDPAIGFELHRRFMAVVVDRLQATRMRLLDLYARDGR